MHPVEVRVLGALLEKDLTTPEYYPLTLNALQNACNQKSSRDPIVHYDEHTVREALELLKNKALALRITGAGHRVEKFAHRLGEKLNLGRRELAILCVMMLRGPQTVGEIRGRTERMHDFADMEEVERVLESLASRPEALVARAPRGRWVHLFSGEPDLSSDVQDAAPAAGIGSNNLESRVAALETEVAELKARLAAFERQFQ